MGYLLILAAQLVSADEFAHRVDVVRAQAERLEAIQVSPELEAEKRTKLTEMMQALQAGADTPESFDALYDKVEGVRMWLWEHASERPEKASGTAEEDEEYWSATTSDLSLRIRKADLAMSVSTAAAVWEFAPCDGGDVESALGSFSLASAQTRQFEPFGPGYAVSFTLHLEDFPTAPALSLALSFNLIGDDLVIELTAPSDSIDLGAVNWPKAIVLPNEPDVFSVVPLMQGALIPNDWKQEIHRTDLSNSRTLYMPWWGHLNGEHGVIAIWETSDDAGISLNHPPGGPTVVQPRLYASMKRVRHLRIVRYSFSDEATHVSLAKQYRDYVIENGRFVSLEEKRMRTPALDEVIGRPVIHIGSMYHTVRASGHFNQERPEANDSFQSFEAIAGALRNAKANGLEDAYVHLDGWGFYGYDNGHPDVLPAGAEQGGWDGLRNVADTCDELGYLFAVHDQYRDFYVNAVSHDARLALMRADGERPHMSQWCGGEHRVLSPRFAPGYVRRNHDLFAANGVKVKGAYLDVFAVVPLEESFDPIHPVTRYECGEYRRQCFELLKARGYVVSSEEPADYLVRTIHLVHHGPYYTTKLERGDAIGIPVPLFNLVYHDSLLLPWDMGEDGGWGIPIGDAGRLHCLLNAGLPYVSPGATGEGLARVVEAASLAKRVGMQEMVGHEFLSPNRRVQRATYTDGTQVTVDFETKEYTVAFSGATQ